MDYEQSETGNWNIAENWANSMIFKPFFEASQYLTIAKFGCSDITEDFEFSEQLKVDSRIKALNWAKDKIEMGIRQSLFAIRNKSDKDRLNIHLKDIQELDEPIKLISEKLVDRDSYKIRINEEYFNFVYKVLIRIYTEVTEPMNKNDLIFNYREQFNPAEYKKSVKDRFVQGG